jgi:hypothetical protein
MRRSIFVGLSIAITIVAHGCSGERSRGVSDAAGQHGQAATNEVAVVELADDTPTGRDVAVFLSGDERSGIESVREARVESTAPAQCAFEDAQESTPVEYVVRRGDTMFAISSRFYGTDVYHALLAKYNSLSDPSRIRPGEVLTVPPIAEFPYRLHRVAAGDNLLSLARRFYETAEYNEALLFADAIAEANGFTVIDRIATGSVLVVPHAHGVGHDIEAGDRGAPRTWLGGGRREATPTGVEKPVCKVDEPARGADEPAREVEQDTTGVVTAPGVLSRAERSGE